MRAILDVIDRYREAFNVLHHEARYFERRPQYRTAMRKIGSDYLGAVAEIIERGRRLGVIHFEDSRSAVHAIHMLCAGWAMGANNLKEHRQGNLLARDCGDCRRPFFRIRQWSEPLPLATRRSCIEELRMALYDRRTLDGVYSVRQSVIYIQNYRYAEERMMRMMAGWIALTPELAVKLEMAKQVYEDALHTDALGKRLPELRAQPQVSKPPNDAFVTFMNAIEDKEEWEDTIERLVGNLSGAEAASDFALQLASDGDESGVRAPYPANFAAAGRRGEGARRARQRAARRVARLEGKASARGELAIASRGIARRVGRSDGL